MKWKHRLYNLNPFARQEYCHSGLLRVKLPLSFRFNSLKRKILYKGIQITDMFKTGICPNCGKSTWLKWHGPFCNRQCLDEAMEYDIEMRIAQDMVWGKEIDVENKQTK